MYSACLKHNHKMYYLSRIDEQGRAWWSPRPGDALRMPARRAKHYADEQGGRHFYNPPNGGFFIVLT